MVRNIIVVIAVILLIGGLIYGGTLLFSNAPEVKVAKERLKHNRMLEKADDLEKQAMMSLGEMGGYAITKERVALVDASGKVRWQWINAGELVYVIHKKETYKIGGSTEGMTFIMAKDENDQFISGKKGLVPTRSIRFIDINQESPAAKHPGIADPTATPSIPRMSVVAPASVPEIIPEPISPKKVCWNQGTEECYSIDSLTKTGTDVKIVIGDGTPGRTIFTGTEKGGMISGAWKANGYRRGFSLDLATGKGRIEDSNHNWFDLELKSASLTGASFFIQE